MYELSTCIDQPAACNAPLKLYPARFTSISAYRDRKKRTIDQPRTISQSPATAC